MKKKEKQKDEKEKRSLLLGGHASGSGPSLNWTIHCMPSLRYISPRRMLWSSMLALHAVAGWCSWACRPARPPWDDERATGPGPATASEPAMLPADDSEWRERDAGNVGVAGMSESSVVRESELRMAGLLEPGRRTYSIDVQTSETAWGRTSQLAKSPLSATDGPPLLSFLLTRELQQCRRRFFFQCRRRCLWMTWTEFIPAASNYWFWVLKCIT